MPEEAFRCPRCGSNRFVSVSLNGGHTRRPQCVPCGKIHPGYTGGGWRSGHHDSEWTPAADQQAVTP